MKAFMSARSQLLPLRRSFSQFLLSIVYLLIGGGVLEARSEQLETVYPGALPADAENVVCPMMQGSNVPLSLASAVDLALCSNAQIRASWAIIREQAAAVGEARALYWPTLTLSLSELKEDTGYPGSKLPTTSQTEHTVYGSLDWRLFDFGGRAAGRRAAEATLQAAMASRDAVIQKILSAVINAYFESLTAQAVVRDKADEQSVAHDTWASAQRREEIGRGAQSDTLQAATALAKVSLDKNRAMGDFNKAVSNLVYLLGLPPDSPISLPQDLDQTTGAEEQNLTAWLNEAERFHPAIVSARAALDAARDQVKVARSSGRPTLDLTANYYQNGYPYQGLTNTNTNQTTVGLTITVPIFDGFATHYKVAAAEALVKEKEADLDDTEQTTLMGVINAHADAQSSLRNLRASEDLLRAAEEAFESSQRRYASGAAEIVELLATQTARADAKGERVRCVAEWRAARLTLLASAGRLNRSAVQE